MTNEYGAFACDLDCFGQTYVMASWEEEDPLSWWANYGSFTPLLQWLTFKLLSQLASSSCWECNWSTYGSILNVIKNKLTTQRTHDLDCVHNNIKVSRKLSEYLLAPINIGILVRYKFIFTDFYLNNLIKLFKILITLLFVCLTWGDTVDGDSILEITDLSLKDSEIEVVTFDSET